MGVRGLKLRASGMRPTAQSSRARPCSFNPRAPTRGATGSAVGARGVFTFQSTRPHEGRDPAPAAGSLASGRFNPRAPTRGATRHGRPWFRPVRVSIHAPPRGARPHLSKSATAPNSFQSTRPHEGRDTAPEFTDKEDVCFNPRAPTRGATGKKSRRCCWLLVSIHAPPRGARLVEVFREVRRVLFQSTRPHEGRDDPRVLSMGPFSRFNPRAPTRGATKLLARASRLLEFQSTRPHEGRDFYECAMAGNVCGFNPRAPTRGATQSLIAGGTTLHSFNPRAPTRGATN